MGFNSAFKGLRMCWDNCSVQSACSTCYHPSDGSGNSETSNLQRTTFRYM